MINSIILDKKVQNLRVKAEIFNNTSDMYKSCTERTRTDMRFRDMPNRKVRKDWEGVSSYKEMLKLLRDGYDAATNILKVETERYYKIKSETKRSRTYTDVVGYTPHIPNMLMGVPKTMINSKNYATPQKVIDIYYDQTVNSSITTQQIENNGIEIMKAIYSLEQRGYKVNLYVCQSYCQNNDCDIVCIKIKDSNKPLDIRRISFPIAHPSFFRVLGFDWYSKFPLGIWKSGYGRGIGYDYQDKIDSITRKIFGTNAVYIESCKILKKGFQEIEEELMRKKKSVA